MLLLLLRRPLSCSGSLSKRCWSGLWRTRDLPTVVSDGTRCKQRAQPSCGWPTHALLLLRLGSAWPPLRQLGSCHVLLMLWWSWPARQRLRLAWLGCPHKLLLSGPLIQHRLLGQRLGRYVLWRSWPARKHLLLLWPQLGLLTLLFLAGPGCRHLLRRPPSRPPWVLLWRSNAFVRLRLLLLASTSLLYCRVSVIGGDQHRRGRRAWEPASTGSESGGRGIRRNSEWLQQYSHIYLGKEGVVIIIPRHGAARSGPRRGRQPDAAEGSRAGYFALLFTSWQVGSPFGSLLCRSPPLPTATSSNKALSLSWGLEPPALAGCA